MLKAEAIWSTLAWSLVTTAWPVLGLRVEEIILIWIIIMDNIKMDLRAGVV
jgi:hypothetical protein